MDKRQSQGKENMGMQLLFVSGHSFAVLVVTIFCGVLAFYFLKKKKKSAEKESTRGASAPSFICSTPGSDQYDVFLSFRGPDTRKKFTDHVYHSLVRAGTVPIYVFRDDKSISIGEEFASRIFGVIARSKISIPIISENYAASKWCLRELVLMMDCRKSTSHIVWPIFYEVEAADVRYLKGKFGDAFRSSAKRFDKDDIPKFEQALSDVSRLQGWESKKIADGHEGELVREVVKTVLSKLRRDFLLDVTENLVGVDDHVEKIRNWVDRPATTARMIGICGMGGIGKTTLAKKIYNQLSEDFEHCSFIADSRETVDRHGILYVQNQLIQQLLPNERQVQRAGEGVTVLKSRLTRKKVLIILDDIDTIDQLNNLARKHDWFKPGSLIIVTTRYTSILQQSEFGVVYPYELTDLNEEQSLRLFNRHAFHTDHSLPEFDDICQSIVSTVGGLPLALKVTGSYLFGKIDQSIWKDVLRKLENRPLKRVEETLRISYDALDYTQQQILLDIACFFISEESRFVTYMWKDCGFYPSDGINELKTRCLIKIDEDGKFRMHDHLRELGRNVWQEGQLETHSRLWKYEEAIDVMRKQKGTEKIQAICLDNYHFNLWTYRNEHFRNFQRLRILQLRWATLYGDFNRVFPELRWLQWHSIKPGHDLVVTNLHLPQLVVLRLSYNLITERWIGWSLIRAPRLKVLDLANCYLFKCTPDLSAFPELEILILKNYFQLEHVHPSIGKLKSLLSLDLSSCKRLKRLPEQVGELENLKELILDGACNLVEIPWTIGLMRKVEKLSVRECSSLREIPSSIGNLQKLKYLDIRYSGIEKSPSAMERLKKFPGLSAICSTMITFESLEFPLAPVSNIPNLTPRLHRAPYYPEFHGSSSRTDLIVGRMRPIKMKKGHFTVEASTIIKIIQRPILMKKGDFTVKASTTAEGYLVCQP